MIRMSSMGFGPIPAFGVVLPLTLLAWLPASDAIGAGGPEAALASAMQSSRDRLLKDPRGFTIRYSIVVNQDAREGTFLWKTGSTGEIRVLWPRIYNKFDGLSRITEVGVVTHKEGEYNFESMIGAGRSDRFVQIAPYRHGWSAIHLFPLNYQYFDESDQYYTPGRARPSSYWLPSCLASGGYEHVADERISSLLCQVWSLRDRSDKIWICVDRSHVIVKRELHDPASGTLTERVAADRLAEIEPGIWFPRELTLEKYRLTGLMRDVHRHDHTVKVLIERFEFGGVVEGGLHISIPQGAEVDDQVRGLVYQKAPPEVAFSTSLKAARVRLNEPTPQAKPSFGWIRMASIGLVAANVLIFFLRRVARFTVHGA